MSSINGISDFLFIFLVKQLELEIMEHLLAKKSLKKQHLSLISLMNFPFAKTGGTTVVLLQIKDIAI